MSNERTICIASNAFYELINQVIEHVNTKFNVSAAPNWIGTDDAMTLLQIKSKTTLLQLRAEGKIRYSQPQHKVILYDRQSIVDYIEKHAHNTF